MARRPRGTPRPPGRRCVPARRRPGATRCRRTSPAAGQPGHRFAEQDQRPVEGAFEPGRGDVGEPVGLGENQAPQPEHAGLQQPVEEAPGQVTEGLPHVGGLIQGAREGRREAVDHLAGGAEDDFGEQMLLVLELLVDGLFSTPRPGRPLRPCWLRGSRAAGTPRWPPEGSRRLRAVRPSPVPPPDTSGPGSPAPGWTGRAQRTPPKPARFREGRRIRMNMTAVFRGDPA
jgi:hypothetical protein